MAPTKATSHSPARMAWHAVCTAYILLAQAESIVMLLNLVTADASHSLVTCLGPKRSKKCETRLARSDSDMPTAECLLPNDISSDD